MGSQEGKEKKTQKTAAVLRSRLLMSEKFKLAAVRVKWVQMCMYLNQDNDDDQVILLYK